MELFKLLGIIAINNSEAKNALKETTETAKGTAEGLEGVSSSGEKTGGKLGTAFKKIGSGALAVGKAVTKGIMVGAGAVSTLGTLAVKSYADYEQLVGGVDTLFKGSSAKVQEYAKNAYKTAGMSANEYMETVTGFSASLLQSLGGDTEAAADKANMALTDMSDNANKMGTDMESIKNAYSGFAKQNYTMLDNLKLGYGGTKEEMERLLKDAEKFSGVKYDISSYADVVDAIHVIQTEMGITGTTAKEAASTISGSLSSMKGAWQNLLTAIASDDLPFDDYVNAFVDSVSNVANNLMPRIEVVLNGVVQLVDKLAPIIIGKIPELLSTLLPNIIKAATGLINSIVAILPDLIQMLVTSVIPQLLDGLLSVINALVSALPSIVEAIVSALPTLIPQLINGIVSVIVNICTMIPQLIQPLIDNLPAIIMSIVDALLTNLPVLIDGVMQLFNGLVEAIPQLLISLYDMLPDIMADVVDSLTANLPILIDGVIKLVMGLVEALPAIITAITEYIPKIIALIVQAVQDNLPVVIEGVIQLIMGIVAALPQIIQALVDALPVIITAVINGVLACLPQIIQGAVQLVMALVQALPQIFSALVQGVVGIHKGMWTAVKNVFAPVREWFSNMWNSLGNVPGLAQLKTMIENVWGAIKNHITTVVNAIKNVVTTVWNSIKNVVGTVVNAIKTVISSAWNTIKTIIQNVMKIITSVLKGDWEGVKTAISNIINAIKQHISTVWNAIKSVISSVMNAIKSVVSSVWNGIKSVITSAVNTVKSVVTSVWNGIRSATSNVFNGIKTTASKAWEDVKNAITKPIEKARDKVKGIVDKIKGFFTGMKLEFPKIKVPHFSIKPSGWKVGDLLDGKIPKLGIEWYAKAMRKPMVMKQPTIFGYNSATGKLQGGGDAGSEVVSGTNTLMGMIQSAVANENGVLVYYFNRIIEILATYFPQVLEAAGHDIVAEDGTILAYYAPKFDKELGKIKERKDRGR